MLIFFSTGHQKVLLWHAMIVTLFELKLKELWPLEIEEFNIESNGAIN